MSQNISHIIFFALMKNNVGDGSRPVFRLTGEFIESKKIVKCVFDVLMVFDNESGTQHAVEFRERVNESLNVIGIISDFVFVI